jgi:hypothetical protein
VLTRLYSAKNGEPWSDVWNRDVSLCAGFDQRMHLKKQSKTTLPCYPATVVYGHAASRGLDIKRWSVGLDSGCVCRSSSSFMFPTLTVYSQVYEKRLSSLVLDYKSQNSHFEEGDTQVEARKKLTIPFGEGSGHIVSVSCS